MCKTMFGKEKHHLARPIDELGGHWDAFQFFLRTHPSQTLFCTYHYLLAILNFPQLCMAVWSERHVMQLDKRLLKLARTLWLIVSSRSAGPQKILNGKYIYKKSFKLA